MHKLLLLSFFKNRPHLRVLLPLLKMGRKGTSILLPPPPPAGTEQIPCDYTNIKKVALCVCVCVCVHL